MLSNFAIRNARMCASRILPVASFHSRAVGIQLDQLKKLQNQPTIDFEAMRGMSEIESEVINPGYDIQDDLVEQIIKPKRVNKNSEPAEMATAESREYVEDIKQRL